MDWETLSTKKVFEHPHHLPIVEDRVRLPDGTEVDWLRYGDVRDGYQVVETVTAICQTGDGRPPRTQMLARSARPRRASTSCGGIIR